MLNDEEPQNTGWTSKNPHTTTLEQLQTTKKLLETPTTSKNFPEPLKNHSRTTSNHRTATKKNLKRPRTIWDYLKPLMGHQELGWLLWKHRKSVLNEAILWLTD